MSQETSCLIQEKEEIMHMLCTYRDAFNLRDKMFTCPNTEVGIDVVDKSPFFIRPYHAKEEIKQTLVRKMKGYVIWIY